MAEGEVDIGRTIAALYEAIETTEDLESVVTKLEQSRITLKAT